ncbi:MAG: NTP transferase domain-containing protein [Deltaproteobacteria bacterium]|nr:NTP transferase domain-containing protein [Deltaproteobacteria bacterium]
MKAVILAAGIGNRLGTHTTALPKALVPVQGRPLIHHTMGFLARPEISEVIVVGGREFAGVAAAAEKCNPKAVCIENPSYRLGNIESLIAARHLLTEDFLLCNVDHLYRPAILERLLDARSASLCCVAADRDRSLTADDMKIATDGHGWLVAIDKGLVRFDAGYIGLTYCPRSCHAVYWSAMEATRERCGPMACVEAILATLAATRTQVAVIDVSGIGWVEVDTPDDLERAEDFQCR